MSEGSSVGRRIRGWEIEVVVVPPGTLSPNPHHPLAHHSPEQRLEAFSEALEPFLPYLLDGVPSGSMGTVLEPRGKADGEEEGTGTGSEALARRRLRQSLNCDAA